MLTALLFDTVEVIDHIVAFGGLTRVYRSDILIIERKLARLLFFIRFFLLFDLRTNI